MMLKTTKCQNAANTDRFDEINKEAHAIDVEFDNSYGGKNFLETGCFLNPNVASVCLADTQKALDGYEGIKERMMPSGKTKAEPKIRYR